MYDHSRSGGTGSDTFASLPARELQISGFLNNCGVHCFVPEILRAVVYFASQKSGHVTEVMEELEARQGAYEELKTTFARHYGIDGDFTWTNFHLLLTTKLHHNSYAQQVIMGPVLRAFMHTQGIELGCSIVDTDQDSYLTLNVDQLEEYLARPLGFGVVDTTSGRRVNVEVLGADSAPGNYATVTIYNSGIHWERNDDAMISISVARDACESDVPALRNITGYAGDTALQKLTKVAGVVRGLHTGSPVDVVRHSAEAVLPSWENAEATRIMSNYESKSSAGLFAQCKSKYEERKIELTDDALNQATAESGENDEDFSARLQYAEYLKATTPRSRL